MNPKIIRRRIQLAEKEGWGILEKELTDEERFEKKSRYRIIAEGQEFPLAHPYQIHLSFYRSKGKEAKLSHMIRVHDFLWPKEKLTWNDWEERTFAAHCGVGSADGMWNYIGLAGGSGIGKSRRVAKISIIWWIADPKNRAGIIASTTLDSLETRIWGYVVKLFEEAVLPLPVRLSESKPPKYRHKNSKDKIAGLFAVAVREGDDKRTLSTLIGRHPEGGIMFVLDESPDMSQNVVKSFSNLEQSTESFQVWAIGNSSDESDLHGAICAPAAGYESVVRGRDDLWLTNRKNGICLYFDPYKSPAITEKDVVKRARLSRFLPTLAKIQEQIEKYGADSETVWRFTFGFWKRAGMDRHVMSEPFLQEHDVFKFAEWSGFNILHVVAGLDPEFQVGGTGCLLRLAVLGQMTDGKVGLDYRGTELLFRIGIKRSLAQSGERQIALQVIKKLREFNCPLWAMSVDVTGAGRAIPELIMVIAGETISPIKISSARAKGRDGKVDPSILVRSPNDMWFEYRSFIQEGQVRGLDRITISQLTSRLVKDGKLESKVDYKTRMAAVNPALAHSPDEADSAILAQQAASIRYGFLPGQRRDLVLARQGKSFQQEKDWVREEERKAQQQKENRTALYKRVPLVPNFSGGLADVAAMKRKRH